MFSPATGAVPISDSALPYYFLTANIGTFFGGLLVSWALDAAGLTKTTDGIAQNRHVTAHRGEQAVVGRGLGEA